jgi:ribulose-5-phosphate 4-epimerase/fuculose-1-phosphate aldolase
MGHHGVTVIGPDIASAFDELYFAERTMMYQMTAMYTGKKLKSLPDSARQNYNGPWGERLDARMHLDAVRRVLDRREPDYKS